MMTKKYWANILLFGLPLGIWLYLFWPFLGPNPTLGGETFTIYSLFKFYFNNLQQGIYPLWNPYSCWGLPTAIYLRHLAEFNPFFFLMPGLNLLGMDFAHAFLTVIVLYYFLALTGLYLLSKLILKEKFLAYWVALNFLFSFMSFFVFTHLIILLIFVPAIWFFYFFTRFMNDWRGSSFWGCVFTLMLLTVTYLPFYFLTVSAVLFLIGVILYPQSFQMKARETVRFCSRHKLLTILAILAIATATLPSAQTYLDASTHSVVAPSRHGGEDKLFRQGLKMSYIDITDGGISGRMSLEDLFSFLDHIRVNNDGFFYISLLAYIILALSTITVLNRRLVWLGVSTLVVFFISITNATPTHPFLYKFVIGFKLFRNLHYLIPFLMVLFILFCAEQLRLLSQIAVSSGKKRWAMTIFIAGMHLAGFVFLKFHEQVIVSSYITLAVSWIFFTVYYWLESKKRSVWILWGIMIVTLIQPVEVFWHHRNYSCEFRSFVMNEGLKTPMNKATFSFTRPVLNPDDYTRDHNAEAYYYEQLPWLKLTDSPGFVVPYSYGYPTYWSFYLFRSMPTYILRDYTACKFLVYDRIQVVDEDLIDLERTTKIRDHENLAFVYQNKDTPRIQSGAVNQTAPGPQVQVIRGNTDDFKVGPFNVNSIKIFTNFTDQKFLVYNDSFAPQWKAWLNGKPTPLYRANFAFKGVFVPPGRNEIVFRFAPWGGELMYFLILGLFWVSAAVLICLFWQDRQPMTSKNYENV